MHRFILEKFKSLQRSRHDCPACKAKREFTRYIDQQTGLPLREDVGKCNRESNCGYHYTPKQFFADNPTEKDKYKENNTQVWTPQAQAYEQPLNPVRYLDAGIITRSLCLYDENSLYLFFVETFGEVAAQLAFSRYMVGTSKHWQGATVFNQQDVNGNFRQSKVMAYNQETGKRIKKDQPAQKWDYRAGAYCLDIDNGDKIYFAGKAIARDKDANLLQCFFGEHLINEDRTKPIALVESEKTALICSLFLPDYIWIATGGKNGCKWREREVNRVLDYRRVYLFPDLGTITRNKAEDEGKETITVYQLWQEYAATMSGPESVTVSDILLNQATEEEISRGFDLADYFLRDYSYPEVLEGHFKTALTECYTEEKQGEVLNLFLSRGLTKDGARRVINQLIADGWETAA